MSSEDENYVTVTVRARGREVAVPCREAVVVTMRPGGVPGPAIHVGDLDPESLPVLAEAAVSELVSFGVRAGIPEDRAHRARLRGGARRVLGGGRARGGPIRPEYRCGRGVWQGGEG